MNVENHQDFAGYCLLDIILVPHKNKGMITGNVNESVL
jgi:hypothetical protein